MEKKQKNVQLLQKSHLEFLSQLTKWIMDKKRSRADLEKLVHFHSIEQTVFRRIVSYALNRPRAIWYFNKYFNNLFKFNSYDTVDLICSMVPVFEANGMRSSHDLCFVRADTNKDPNRNRVKTTIGKFYNAVHDHDLSDGELNQYYNLYQFGIITEEVVKYMHSTLEGKSPDHVPSLNNPRIGSKTFSQIILENESNENIQTEIGPVEEYRQSIIEKISSRDECIDCVLNGREQFVFQTNAKQFGRIDIMFYGLNPIIDESKYGIDEAKNLEESFIEIISTHLPDNAKWMILNSTMCRFRNRKDISPDEHVEATDRCSSLLNEISGNFEPEIMVFIGEDISHMFGLKGDIRTISGKIRENNTVALIDPSVLLGNDNKAKNIFHKSIDAIQKQVLKNMKAHLKKKKPEKEDIKKQVEQKYQRYKLDLTRIPKEQFVEEITEDLTLFDTMELPNNKVLAIFIDPNGIKRYQISEYNFEANIKYGLYDECTMISKETDETITMTEFEKQRLNKLLRQKACEQKNI